MEPLFPGHRGGEPRSLSDALLPRLVPATDLADEDLVNDPSSARPAYEIAKEIDDTVDVLGEAERAERSGARPSLSGPQRTTFRERIPRLQRALECASERERRAQLRQRPADCWCLGLGGRGTLARTPGEPIDAEAQQWNAKLDETAWNSVATGRAIERAAVYCTCPDGNARREREAQRRADWLSGFHAGQQAERLMARWAVSRLPPMDELYALEQYPQDSPEQKDTLARLAAWQPPDGLYLFGSMRRGKTTLVMALGLKALQLGYTVQFWTVSGLFEHLKAGIGRGQNQEDLINAIVAFEFLILDDIGASSLTEFEAERLLDILEPRLRHQRPTLFTSNAPPGGTADGTPFGLVTVLAGGNRGALYLSAQRIDARIAEHCALLHVRGEPLNQPLKKRPPLRW